MNNNKTALLLMSILTSVALADTTVVGFARPGFPYDPEIRVYVDRDSVFLECKDNYWNSSYQKVDPVRLLWAFKILADWMELHKQEKGFVSKPLERASVKIRFFGDVSGDSEATIELSTTCTVKQYEVKTLIRGIENNLDNARSEDKKDKADLFR